MKVATLITLAVGGTVALLASAACSSDSNGDGGSSPTGSGGACGCLSCADYTVACITECPAGDPRDVICEASLPTVAALNECVCDPNIGNCVKECAYTCSLELNQGGGSPGSGSGGGAGGLVDSTGCTQCQNNAVMKGSKPCEAAWNACALDNIAKCN